MSYEKQQWAAGDIITADKLNAMDNEIERLGSEASGGGTEFMVVTIAHVSTSTEEMMGDVDTYTSDKTLAEIVEAYTAGTPILMHNVEVVNGKEMDQGYWICSFAAMEPDFYFETSRLSVNPTLQTLSTTTYAIQADGTVTVQENSYTLTPTT